MTLIRITWKLLVLLTVLIFVGTLHAADKTGQDEWRFASYGKAAKGSVTMDSNTLTIKTENTKNAFFESDEYSFAYKEQPFLHDDCSKSVITVKIDDIKKGSAGIMKVRRMYILKRLLPEIYSFFLDSRKEGVPLTDEWGISVFLLR
mgnify:CR=1 FL=1